jgi:hypothetical protein
MKLKIFFKNKLKIFFLSVILTFNIFFFFTNKFNLNNDAQHYPNHFRDFNFLNYLPHNPNYLHHHLPH